MYMSTTLGGLHIHSLLSGSLGRALLENLLDHRLDEIGWDRKIDTIGRGVGLGICGTREWDADKLPLQIDQGPTAIAGIEGGIGLDSVGNGDAGRFGDAAVEGAHDALGRCPSDS